MSQTVEKGSMKPCLQELHTCMNTQLTALTSALLPVVLWFLQQTSVLSKSPWEVMR